MRIMVRYLLTLSAFKYFTSVRGFNVFPVICMLIASSFASSVRFSCFPVSAALCLLLCFHYSRFASARSIVSVKKGKSFFQGVNI